MQTYLLTIDTGSSSSKIAIFDTQGTLIHLIRKSTSAIRRDAGHAVREYAPETWWETTAEGIRELLQKSGLSSACIAAIGLTGQIGTHILVDQEHVPVMSAISWQDGRAADQAKWLSEHYHSTQLDQALGMHLPPGTAWPIPRLLWLKQNRPELFDKPFKLLQTKEYLNYMLTGVYATDVLSLRGLVHPKTGKIDPLIQTTILGIPDLQARLPSFGDAMEVVGSVTQKAAEQTGLLAGTPVIAGCGDFHASLVGTGIVDDQFAFTISGTSDHIGRLCRSSDTQAYDERLGRYPSVVDGWDIWYGATSAGGGSLQWFLEQFGERKANQTIQAYVKDMMEGAPAPAPFLFLPYLNGERAPIWDAQAKAGFVGFSSAHTKAHFLRAVLEGVCFSLKDCYSIMQESQKTPAQLRVSGAAGADPVWNQMKADILNTEVVSMQCQESSSLGAAILAATAIGIAPSLSTAVQTMVHPAQQYTPNAKYHDTYEEMFLLYRQLYQQLKPIHEQLARRRSTV